MTRRGVYLTAVDGAPVLVALGADGGRVVVPCRAGDPQPLVAAVRALLALADLQAGGAR